MRPARDPERLTQAGVILEEDLFELMKKFETRVRELLSANASGGELAEELEAEE